MYNRNTLLILTINILFNTSDFSPQNVKNATLEEIKVAFKEILFKLSELPLSNYNFKNKDYSFQEGDYIPWKQYEKIVDREIKNLNIKEIQSQFKNIFNTSLLSLLNYESGLRNFNSYTI